jgi:hypothetical protein
MENGRVEGRRQVNHKEICCEVERCSELAQNRDQWWTSGTDNIEPSDSPASLENNLQLSFSSCLQTRMSSIQNKLLVTCLDILMLNQLFGNYLYRVDLGDVSHVSREMPPPSLE